MKEQLLSININYRELKSILSPANKGDIALIFDWTKISDSCYGEYILKLLMPYLNDNNFCYLHGDYCSYSLDSVEKNIRIEQLKNSLYEKYNSFSDPSSYYIVYITNIGMKKTLTLNDYLKNKEKSYVGFSDLNLNNLFKTFLSLTLVSSFIKYKNNIIEPSLDAKYIEKNEYPNFVVLNQFNYNFFNLNFYYFSIFLDYRIPSIIKQNDKDLYYSLKYLNHDIQYELVNQLNIIISEKKVLYLLREKNYILKKWHLEDVDKIKNFLMSKIKESLAIGEIFDLEFMDEHNTFKFNIFIEHLNRKYKIGLKLLMDKKELFFITLTSIDK
jgi:hypothetical protein